MRKIFCLKLLCRNLLKTFNSSKDEPQFDSSQGTGTWAYFGE